MKNNNIDQIFQALLDVNPDPKTELYYTNNFTLLVAVVLSARMTDKGVNRATLELFKICDNPDSMLKLGVDGLSSYIKTIGLYKTKAKNIIALSRIIIDKHKGIVPNSMDDLLELPGVGRKTANVVLNVAFNFATIPVDTHVGRVANRLKLTNAKNPDVIERDLMSIIPEYWLQYAHHLFVLHGRYICKSQSPKCSECVLQSYCPSRIVV